MSFCEVEISCNLSLTQLLKMSHIQKMKTKGLQESHLKDQPVENIKPQLELKITDHRTKYLYQLKI